MRPTKAGYYRVTVRYALVAAGNGGHTNYISLYKNGASIKTEYSLANYMSSYTQSMEITALIYLNGTTDYLEGYFSTNNANSATIQTGSNANSFSAEWIRP